VLSENYGGGVLIAHGSNLIVEEVTFPVSYVTEIVCVKISINNFNLFSICSYIPSNSPLLISMDHSLAIKYVQSLLKSNDNLMADSLNGSLLPSPNNFS